MSVIVDHPVLIKPDINSIIYRYLDLDKFEKFLSDQALFFCRVDKFSDPFEASCLKMEVAYRKDEILKMSLNSAKLLTDEEALKESQGIGEYHKRSRRSLIVNCWHINNKGESDAMWRLYLKSNEGVAIQSTVRDLIDSFSKNNEDIYISKVRYLDYEKDVYYHSVDYPCRNYNTLTPIVHKRNEFSHESELRLFQQIEEAVEDDTYWNNLEGYEGKNIHCDVQKLIKKIILPPTSDLVVNEKVQSLLDKYNMSFIINKSKLDDEPVY